MRLEPHGVIRQLWMACAVAFQRIFGIKAAVRSGLLLLKIVLQPVWRALNCMPRPEYLNMFLI